MRITVNAGHHKLLDAGAVGLGLREADVTYDIGKILEERLLDAGHKVRFIQADDLGEICEVSNAFDSDYFISIHCNAFNGNASGVETWYYNGSYYGRELAKLIQEEITDIFPKLKDRGIKASSGLYVLRYTTAPAVLVETGFIDNVEDNKLLRLPQFYARAIADAVSRL